METISNDTTIKTHIIESNTKPKNIYDIIDSINISPKGIAEFLRLYYIISSLNWFTSRRVYDYIEEKDAPNIKIKFDLVYGGDTRCETISTTDETWEKINPILGIPNKDIISICFMIVNERWHWFQIKDLSTNQYLKNPKGHQINVLRTNGTIESDWEIHNLSEVIDRTQGRVFLSYSARKDIPSIPSRKIDDPMAISKNITFDKFHQYNPNLKIEVCDAPFEDGPIKIILDAYQEGRF